MVECETSQLRRILNGATTRPGLHVRNRLTRFVKERETRAERAAIDAAHAAIDATRAG